MKLSEIDTSSLNSSSRYYTDGFCLLPVVKQDLLVETLNQMLILDPLRDGYHWDTVLNSHSLRPRAFDYNNSIIDFLFDNKLYEKLSENTDRRLTLSHIQIIKTDPGRSYQDWHRDTYQYKNNWVGNTPVAHKIIFYPVLKEPEPRLKYIRASHRCSMNNQDFDNQLVKHFENEIIESSNERVLMFDTSILHAVIPDATALGSIRIIYNFVSEFQYREKYSNKDHHRILHDIYEERLKL